MQGKDQRRVQPAAAEEHGEHGCARLPPGRHSNPGIVILNGFIVNRAVTQNNWGLSAWNGELKSSHFEQKMAKKRVILSS